MLQMMSIASGSSGNCIYIGSEDTHILVDAGISAKRIEEGLHLIGLNVTDLDGIFITHEHSDHIQGLNVLARKAGIPVFLSHGTHEYIEAMRCPRPIPKELFHEVCADEPVKLKGFTVCPFTISHDCSDPLAFRIDTEDKSAAVITDLGEYNSYIVEHLKQLDGILLEANHDVRMLQTGPYPYPLKRRILGEKGHLSNESAGRLLNQILHDDMKHICLGHLSKENNYEELAYETVRLEVTMGEGPYKGSDFPITIAKREDPSGLVRL